MRLTRVEWDRDEVWESDRGVRVQADAALCLCDLRLGMSCYVSFRVRKETRELEGREVG